MSVISDPLRLPDEERAFVVDDERRRTPKTRRPRLYDAALPAATRLSGSPLRLPARVV